MPGPRRQQRYRRKSASAAHSELEGTQPAAYSDSEIKRAFIDYKSILDSKHDKHEALVKISRDVTIESKRIIFHLHRCVGGDKQTIMAEAEDMINKCINVQLYKMAKELDNCDSYRFTRAITAGLQEFIEAYTFYTYLKSKSLPRIEDVRNRLQFKRPEPEQQQQPEQRQQPAADRSLSESPENVPEGDCRVTGESCGAQPATINIPLSQPDFILGIADLTGELMRMSINSIGWGDMAAPLELCSVLQHLDTLYKTHCSTAGGEMGRKMKTLKQSLAKVENACYTLKVRGSETPKHMLVHSVQSGETAADLPDYDWL